jgi:hypothetical protein
MDWACIDNENFTDLNSKITVIDRFLYLISKHQAGIHVVNELPCYWQSEVHRTK